LLHGRLGKPAEADELLFQDPVLDLQLERVGSVLVLAAPAVAEVTAARQLSLPAGAEDFHRLGADVPRLALPDAHPQPLSWKGVGNKHDGPAGQPPEGVAAVHHALRLDLEQCPEVGAVILHPSILVPPDPARPLLLDEGMWRC
jgi:hypothetical protein